MRSLLVFPLVAFLALASHGQDITTAIPEATPLPGNDTADPSIVRGERVQLGEIPWQAYIQETFPNGEQYICGGSLIHPLWVFTAAHCIDGPAGNSYAVALGGISLTQMPYVQPIAQRIVHEQWDEATFNADVGLIKLPVPAEGPSIRPIPMAPTNLGDITGAAVVVSGFGHIWTGGPASNDLLRANLRAISYQNCAPYFQYLDDNNALCAQWDQTWGQSACNGDSGGPLTAQVNGETVLVGAVSYGTVNGGCHSGNPMAFARVSTYRPWAESKMQEFA